MNLTESLLLALKANGARQIFGIPGDFALPYFRIIEETQILPLAERLLTAQDWSAIHAAIGRVEDPLFGRHPERRYASLHQQIARHAPPPPLR